MPSSEAVCCACDKTYSSRASLRKHLKNIHNLSSSTIKEQVPRKKEGNFQYSCVQCQKCFNHLKHFNYHNRVHHQDPNLKPPEKKVKCPLCFFKGDPGEISQHFTDIHKISYEVENLEFDKWETFVSWKKLVEKRTQCKFNLKGCRRKTTAHYVCHRSGFFKSKGKNMRLLKLQGSKKINGFCPAAINVKIEENVYRAKFISTHVGHSNDLQHIYVSPTKRKKIARQLQLKIPVPVILSKFRNSIEGDVEREHLLTGKDAEKDVSEKDLREKFDSVLNLAKTKQHRKLMMKYLNNMQLCIESDVILQSQPGGKKDTKSKRSKNYTSTKNLFN